MNGRAFNTRKKEHLRNNKTTAKGSKIVNHAWSNNHAIDFENASIIDKGTFRTRKIFSSLSYHSFYSSKTAVRAVESSSEFFNHFNQRSF